MKNNLFTYATSELSQDAFICWLLSYAMKNSKEDEGLKECAKDFLKQFIGETNEKDFIVTEIERQVNHIDVLVTVNDNYKIIIEDKIFSSEHDDQLGRYMKIIKDEYKNCKGVYWKTGFQDDYNEVYKHGYLLMDRNNILKTLKKYLNKTNNNIFHDYYDFWCNYENEANKYKELKLIEWDWDKDNNKYKDKGQFLAFCEYMKNELKKLNSSVNYGIVNPPNGNWFYAIYGNGKEIVNSDKNRILIYLQFEINNDQIKLCLKSSYENVENSKISQIRDSLMYVDNEYRFEKYGFKKPKRVRTWI